MGESSPMSKKIIIKTTLRTVIYQFILLFIFVSCSFLINPLYWGNRAAIVSRSYRHIFDPVEFTPEVEEFIKKIGRTRLYFDIISREGRTPPLFEIVSGSEFVENEEWFMCEYQYVNKKGELDVYEYRTRIKWKPWEFYYPTVEQLGPINDNPAE